MSITIHVNIGISLQKQHLRLVNVYSVCDQKADYFPTLV